MPISTNLTGDLLREAPTFITWPFAQVTNVRSPGSLKNLYVLFLNTYGHKTGQGADFRAERQLVNA